MTPSQPGSTDTRNLPSRGGVPWRRLIFFSFSLLVTVVVFRILFQHISWRDVRDMIVNVHPGWLCGFFAFSLLQLLMRTWRYWMLLNASGQNPPRFALFLVVVVRGLCVDMLPARAGELVYIFLVRTRLGLDLGAATTSFALAFLFDILALAPLLLAGAWALGSGEALSLPVLIGGGLVLMALSLGLIAAMSPVVKWGEGLFRPFAVKGKKWALFLCETADSVLLSLENAKRKKLFWKLLGSSLLVRMCKYTSFYFLILALLIPQGVERSEVAIAPAFIALVSGEMAASLPVSGIGGFGAYEGTMTFVMVMLNFSKELAATLSVSHRLLTQVYGLLQGVSGLLILMLPFFNREPSSTPDPQRPVSS
ncbi:MAG: lysylphosphatidylglycerol synthase transmembrane domain-containing protein [Kiritimatiellia bacterium]